MSQSLLEKYPHLRTLMARKEDTATVVKEEEKSTEQKAGTSKVMRVESVMFCYLVKVG